MAEAKKPAPAAPEPPPAAKPKRNIILYVVIGLLVLVIIAIVAVGGFLFLTLNQNPAAAAADPAAAEESDGHAEKPKKKKKEHKSGESNNPVFVKLDTFTVNLQGGGSVLQTEIHVQVADEHQKDTITGYLPRISSQVNLLLSSKKADELQTVEAKVKLMEDIKVAINKVLNARDDDDGVKSVEFKTFIIQ